MTHLNDQTLPPLDGWALVLGASSGFGEATALTLAKVGMNIVGVHLDRRATLPNVERIQASIRELGRESFYYNVNAADPEKRKEVLDDVARRFAERGQGEQLRVMLHSLAFGTLKNFVAEQQEDELNQKQMEMTMDVMAHSLVYWSQDVVRRQLMGANGRIFAMTSEGSHTVWHGYGAVSAAKAALEAHVRQLASELASKKITVNAICAGVTDTPAARKIPGFDVIVKGSIANNPNGRLTRPEDVASCLVALAQPCTHWLNGGVIYVDGGESHCG